MRSSQQRATLDANLPPRNTRPLLVAGVALLLVNCSAIVTPFDEEVLSDRSSKVGAEMRMSSAASKTASLRAGLGCHTRGTGALLDDRGSALLATGVSEGKASPTFAAPRQITNAWRPN